MIKAEKGTCAVEGYQNALFVEMTTIMYAIREKLRNKEALNENAWNKDYSQCGNR